MTCANRVSLFTVASLLILGVLLLAIELPRRHGERIHRAELRAIRTLERVHELEVSHLRDGSDTGRFGFLREIGQLVGFESLRGAGGDGGILDSQADDWVQSGYRFRVYLPNADGHGVGYSKRQQVHRRRARMYFACYAWPQVFGDAGRRTFLFLSYGATLATENQRRCYEGMARAPHPGAGFVAADPGSIVDPPAVKAGDERGRGIDGQFWVRLTRPDRHVPSSE